MHSPAALPVLALVLNALVWGLSWIAFKALHQHGLHPLWATSLIYGGALALLLAVRPAGLRGVRQHPWLLLLAVSAGLTNVGFNWGVTIGDVMRVVLLFYLMPLWSTGLAWWLLGERPTPAALLRLVLALAGVALVLGRPAAAGPAGEAPPGLADALALMAGFGFALTNTLLRRWRATPADARAVAMFGGGFVLSTTLALLVVGAAGQPPAPNWEWTPWALLLGLAFLSGNLALQYGAARLPAQVTSLIMLSEVVFASASAVLLGASWPDAATWLGGALILGAALLAVLRGRSQ
ncbi:MAG: DMT family transporter [Pseudomonadota bacterium]|nr:DMT family transporter [Pseudomonadota bacterium]